MNWSISVLIAHRRLRPNPAGSPADAHDAPVARTEIPELAGFRTVAVPPDARSARHRRTSTLGAGLGGGSGLGGDAVKTEGTRSVVPRSHPHWFMTSQTVSPPIGGLCTVSSSSNMRT